jgi:hypothetical protein
MITAMPLLSHFIMNYMDMSYFAVSPMLGGQGDVNLQRG